MRVEPARIEQVRLTDDGGIVMISADASQVAKDLEDIDRGLKVRFAETGTPPFWIVYHEWHPDCPHNGEGAPVYPVLTARAYLTHTGVWAGLDNRVVERIRQINPAGRAHYDFAKEVEKQNEQARKRHREEFREKVAPIGELAAHALRKDLGRRYKGRTFVPREVNG